MEAFLWETKPRGRGAALLRVLALAVWKFQHDKGLLRASALAFSSALGLIPLLALAFAALSFVGYGPRLEQVLLGHLTGENEEVARWLSKFLSRVHVSSLGWVGLGSLAVSTLLVFDTVEDSFNAIWGVGQARRLWRKILVYTVVLVVCPLLLLLSASLVAAAQVANLRAELAWLGEFLDILFFFAPLFAKGIAFAALFFLMPHHKVRYRDALAGGLLAALLGHAAEWGFLRFQFGAAWNNAVYGVMAQLPAFLLWLYAIWSITLACAEVTCVLGRLSRGEDLRE